MFSRIYATYLYVWHSPHTPPLLHAHARPTPIRSSPLSYGAIIPYEKPPGPTRLRSAGIYDAPINGLRSIEARILNADTYGQVFDMRLQNTRGITLLEVMISMVMLALGALGLAQLIGLTVYNNTLSNDSAIVDAMAREKLESLLKTPNFDSMPFVEIEDSVLGEYSVMKRVDDISTDSAIPIGLYKVSLQMKWTDPYNEPHMRSYVTLRPQ
jgi:hypothetical protein